MTPTLNNVIQDIVLGDALEITRTITNIDTADLLARAWLTLKRVDDTRDDDQEALFSKEITTVDNPGVGQITDAGITDGIGAVRFDIRNADYALGAPGAIKPFIPYKYDIQVQTVGGLIYTPEKGTLTWTGESTKDTS